MDFSEWNKELDNISKKQNWVFSIKEIILLHPQKYVQLEAILAKDQYKYYIAGEIIHIQIPKQASREAQHDLEQDELYDWLEQIKRPLYLFAGYKRVPNVPIDTLLIYHDAHNIVLPRYPNIKTISSYFHHPALLDYCKRFSINLQFLERTVGQ